MGVSIYSRRGTELLEGPNFSNDNFKDIFSVLGYDEISWEGEIGGDELVDLKNRIIGALCLVEKRPDEFLVREVVIEMKNVTIVNMGKEPEYFIRKFNELLKFINESENLIWC